MMGVCGSCQSGPLWPFPAKSASPHEQATPKSSSLTTRASREAAPNTIQFVQLILEVVRAEFPVNQSRHSRKVWNHVDELRIEPELNALLSRNGLRVGVASTDAWPAISAVFDAAGAAVHSDQLAAQPGIPVNLPMAKITESESLFIHGPEGRLAGKTFSAGEKALTLDYAVRPEFGNATDLVLHFEVRQDRGVMTWERQADGTTRQVPAMDRDVFDELATGVTLRDNEFLVIGQSAAVADNLLGGSFLTRQLDRGKVELLLFISPRSFRTPAETRPRL